MYKTRSIISSSIIIRDYYDVAAVIVIPVFIVISYGTVYIGERILIIDKRSTEHWSKCKKNCTNNPERRGYK